MAKVLITCIECGAEKSKKGVYCKSCSYKHRTRPSGLKYTLRKVNPTTFKKGQKPWNAGVKGLHFSIDTEIKKRQRLSPSTEFKKGQKPWNYKGKPKCVDCSVVVSTHLSKRCVECAAKAKSGSSSPFWKGGHSKHYKEMYHTRFYRRWRKAVFERDNYTCQDCGVRGVYLEPHHIKQWALYPDLRFDVDNGQTLCKECHRKTSTYGVKGRI